VNPDNLAELQNFFDVFGEFEVETLQVRPIIDLGKVAYTKKDMTPFLTRYNEILDSLAKECSQRGTRLLFNRWDPTYATPNTYASVYTAGVVHLSGPEKFVPMDSRLWRNPTKPLGNVRVFGNACYALRWEESRSR
jgi:hypothetical protein